MSLKFEVLVVDDEEGIRDVVGEIIAAKGFTFACAANSSEAKQLLQEGQPRLVICDISMPGGSGLELLKQVREQGLTAAFVMLTAHAESQRVIETLRLGALDYITKPFNASELIAKLDTWVEVGKRLRDMHDPAVSHSEADLARQLRMIELFQLKNNRLS